MDYIVLQAFQRAVLAREVVKHLKDGWVCQGGVSTIYSQAEGVCLFQAMAKPTA